MEPATPVPGDSLVPCETSGTTAAENSTNAIDLHVCVLCRLSAEEDVRSGRRLHDALVAAQLRGEQDGARPASVRIVPVDCLSNCNRSCSVAFAGPNRWTYVYGGLSPDSAAAVLDGAARYAASPDGIVPWRERPEALRQGLVARIPPLTLQTIAPQDP